MRLSADVEDVRPLENRDQEVSPFSNSLIQHSPETIEQHRSLAAVHRVERRGQYRRRRAETKRRLGNVREERNRCLASHR